MTGMKSRPEGGYVVVAPEYPGTWQGGASSHFVAWLESLPMALEGQFFLDPVHSGDTHISQLGYLFHSVAVTFE